MTDRPTNPPSPWKVGDALERPRDGARIVAAEYHVMAAKDLLADGWRRCTPSPLLDGEMPIRRILERWFPGAPKHAVEAACEIAKLIEPVQPMGQPSPRPRTCLDPESTGSACVCCQTAWFREDKAARGEPTEQEKPAYTMSGPDYEEWMRTGENRPGAPCAGRPADTYSGHGQDQGVGAEHQGVGAEHGADGPASGSAGQGGPEGVRGRDGGLGGGAGEPDREPVRRGVHGGPGERDPGGHPGGPGQALGQRAGVLSDPPTSDGTVRYRQQGEATLSTVLVDSGDVVTVSESEGTDVRPSAAEKDPKP